MDLDFKFSRSRIRFTVEDVEEVKKRTSIPSETDPATESRLLTLEGAIQNQLRLMEAVAAGVRDLKATVEEKHPEVEFNDDDEPPANAPDGWNKDWEYDEETSTWYDENGEIVE